MVLDTTIVVMYILTILIPINGLLYLAKKKEREKLLRLLRMYYNRKLG